MGARSSKQKAQKSGAFPAFERSDTLDKTMTGRSFACLDDAVTGSVQSMLEMCKPLEEQSTFFNHWLEAVFKPVYGGQHDPTVVIATDLSNLEVRVTADAGKAQELAQSLVQTCNISQVMLEHMKMTVTQLNCQTASLWCRLKRLGGTSPALDFGFSVSTPVPWVVAELLLPPISDAELLREHAKKQELLTPCGYSCSLVNVEPEHSLEFDVKEAASAGKNHCYAGLFFFKALGFAKPDDSVVRALINLSAPQMGVRCSMGPKGLTRMSMIFMDPLQPDARALADAVGFPLAEDLYRLPKRLGMSPNTIVFAAEDRGYTVSVGFLV